MVATAQGTEIRFNQPDFAYRQAEGVSQSELKEMLRSPAHWLARYGPNAEPSYPSAAMIIGTALHAKLLEPEAFNGMFYDRSEKPRDLTIPELRAALAADGVEIPTGKKLLKGDLEALLYPDGKPVDKRHSLSSDDFSIVTGMAESMRTHSIAGKWFDPGRADYRRANELSLYVEASAETFGLPIKGRIDRLEKTADGWAILDLKSTDDASPDSFMKKAYNLSYHIQSAFYTDLVKTVFQAENVEFLFCAVERKRPHGIKVYRASEDMIAVGREQYRQALRLLRRCKDLNEYPGYSVQIDELKLPAWASRDRMIF